MIREYRNGDALKVAVQKAQLEEAFEGAAYFDNVGRYSLVEDDGRVAAVFGFVGEAGGMVECYALIAGDVGRKLLEAVHFFWRKIPEIWERLGFVCARMTVKKDFVQGARFARLLGFELVGELPKFYNENDYQLFERIL